MIQDLEEDTGPSKSLVRNLYLLVLVQFIVIAILWSAISNEYSNSPSMRLWIAKNASFLGLLLDGGLGSILVGLSAGWTALVLGRTVYAHIGKKENAEVNSEDETSESLAHKIREILLLEEEAQN